MRRSRRRQGLHARESPSRKNEVRALLRAARQSKRYAARNHAMILLAFRHGFRTSELVELRIGGVDFRAGTLSVRRRKGSKSNVHPMKPDELEAIERLLRRREVDAKDYVFSSERGAKLSRFGFWRIVSEAGERAGLPLNRYAHQLRHACGITSRTRGAI